MDTPASPHMADDHGIYGAARDCINRRRAIAGIAAVATGALAPFPALAARRRTTIGWDGTATVVDRDVSLDLTVRTRIQPFSHARSTSWITREGESSARTMVITPSGGWVERGGTRKELPSAQAAHERQQFGIYGYFLRATRATGEAIASLTLREPGFPVAAFTLDDGWPVAADYRVAAPDTGRPPIAEHFVFEGVTTAGSQRWFRRMVLTQAGKPFFTLAIDRLIVGHA